MLLNTHTFYSLNYGVLSTLEYLELLKSYGYQNAALTDINNTSACLDFIRLAPSYGIKPIVGIDFRNGVEQQYVAIAQNNEGFQELNTFLSNHLHGKIPFDPIAPNFNNAHVIYPFRKYNGQKLKEQEWIGVNPQDLKRLRFSKWKHKLHKMVAMPTCSFVKKQQYQAHRLLRAINQNTLITTLSENQIGSPTQVFPTAKQLRDKYHEYPNLLTNSCHILDQCSIHFVFKNPLHHENKKHLNNSGKEDFIQIKQLCKEGLIYRYGHHPSTEVTDRLEKELDLIAKKGFVGYFLMNWKIIRYAQSKDYYYVGRGSGANSIVAYLLRITDVDPIELDLYFERFMNLYRQNPPDFDIDFSWKDRDDVTDYIFKEFPTASLLGTYNTFKARAVLREMGKVFGLPKHEQDKLRNSKLNFNQLDSAAQNIVSYATLVEGFPSHLSIHASGILIPEKEIHYFGGTFMPPKGYRTTQFSMIEAEDVGLFKFDILSQRGLGKIKDAITLIKENQPHNPPEDIRNISKFKTDPKVNELLKNGTAIGCFYVESPAMRMLLSKLSVDDYLGLVAASSIIRPGVSKSGMMKEYILRHHGLPSIKETPKEIMDIMPETYGVMVYQEDVIKVAHLFAGLTLAEADELRRGMSGKYRSRDEFLKVKKQFFSNCQDRGHSEHLTNEIWLQIESFAGYAFSKGHSASYAVESYQCLYLKAYYPLEYMVATINNFGGFYRNETYIHEAKMLGASIHPPCVNKSGNYTQLYKKDIYLGLNFIAGLEINSIIRLTQERKHNGDFLSFENFIDRVELSLEQLVLLIRINAFRFSGINKRELLWKAYHNVSKKASKAPHPKLFFSSRKNVVVPELEYHKHETILDQIELLGFPLESPFRLIINQDYKKVLANDLSKYLDQDILIRGYLVNIKKTSTSNGKTMNFGTFLDEDGHFFDTTHFPPSLEKYPFRGMGIYTIYGKVVEEFGFFSLEVISQEKEVYETDGD